MTTKKEVKHQRIKARTKNSFVKAYDNSLGNVSAACKMLHISRNCFYEWMKSDPIFKDSIEEIDEGCLDFSETMLKKNVREGKEASIFFHLKTKGKSRGYVEREEVVRTDTVINLVVDSEDMKA